MKKTILLAALLVLASPLCAEPLKTVFNPFTGKPDYITALSSGTLPAGSTQYIQNTNALQDGSTFYVSSGTVSGTLTAGTLVASGLSSGLCVQTGTGGILTSAASACGSGGGTSFILGITTGTASGFSGVATSSPTNTIVFDSNTTTGQLTGGATYFFALKSSSVTLQGNTFNGTSQLVQTNGSSQFPALNGSLITNLNASNFASGTLPAGQFPALTGDITTSAGSLATAAAALQSRITTFSSSITVTNTSGFQAKFAVLASTIPTVVGSTSTQTTTAQFEVIGSTVNTNLVEFSTSATGSPLVTVSTVPASSPNDFILTVASTTSGIALFGVQLSGHVVSSGTTPSVTSCGTSPSVDAKSTDFAGVINTGSASPTACTLTFANAFANSPVCIVSDDLQTSEPAVTSRSTTAITITLGAALSSGHIFYVCVGEKG